MAKKPGNISVKDIVDATIYPQSLASDLSTQLWANLEKHMQNQMSQIMLSHILANTYIKIDPVHQCLGAKLARAQEHKKHLRKVATKTSASEAPHIFGPNSAFNFDKVTLQR